MITIKKIVLFKHFKFFYSYLGVKIFVAMIISIIVGLLDGFGLAMFLPLLQMLDGQELSSSEGMGNLSFIADAIKFIGLELNFLVVMLTILFLFVLKGIMRFTESIYNVTVQQHFAMVIRKECIDILCDFGYKGFIKSDSGRIQNTLSGEVGRVLGAYSSYRSFLQNGITVMVYVTLAFISNPQFAIFVAIGAFLSNFIFSSIYKKTKKLSKSITLFGHVYQGLLIQSVAFFKYLKATGRFDGYANKMRQSIQDIEATNKKMGYINSFVGAAREPIVMSVVVGVIVLQVLVFDQKLGLLILSLLFFQRSLNFVMAIQTSWNAFLSMSGSLENLQEFLHELKTQKENRGTKTVETFNGSIVLKNVYFSYNDNDYILKDINLNLNSNQTTAFVGESGSGKTTLVNILSGLLPVEKGSLEIDGIDTKELDLRTFQNRIGYITQEPVIFKDDVFNNVTFWAERTPENLERFWIAMEKASIADFIKSLPEKENAPLGNNGVMVSGGQKQRISIARELYKDIDILIMDEATSALDSETEKAIQENIDALKGKYTILIVAHRLSTIKNADKIVVMSKGEIVNTGNFTELINQNESFQRMVSLQEL
jgi:ABC-type multidrug transport system fused ATPase/permease subunit